MSGFDIGSRHVGDGAPCLIVAEVAQAHEGSLAMAHAYIDAIADAGADAVKFQCHIAEAESTPDEPWRVEPKYKQDANRYAYWKRMEFDEHQWLGLAMHCWKRNVRFLCSPFSVRAVEMLDPFSRFWKIASGEVTNEALFRAIARTGKPVLISTGMDCDETEMDQNSCLQLLEIHRVPYRFMACTSLYPTPPEKIDLVAAQGFRGLSDHSGTIYAGLAAVALGCDVLEVHVKLSAHDQGFDASSSITVEKLRELVEGVRFIEKAKRPVDKDALARELEPMRRLFMDKHKRKADEEIVRGRNATAVELAGMKAVRDFMNRPR